MNIGNIDSQRTKIVIKVGEFGEINRSRRMKINLISTFSSIFNAQRYNKIGTGILRWHDFYLPQFKAQLTFSQIYLNEEDDSVFGSFRYCYAIRIIYQGS